MAHGLHVYIVESLPAEDINAGADTGRHIHEDLRIMGVDTTYTRTQNRREFFDALHGYKDRHKSSWDKFCCLHISAHGHDYGLQLGNRTDLVNWGDLRDELCNLNAAVAERLIIGMCSCAGLFAELLVDLESRLPFIALVGSYEKISFHEDATGFGEFYQRLATDTPIDEAVTHMRMRSGHHRFQAISGDDHQWLTVARAKVRASIARRIKAESTSSML